MKKDPENKPKKIYPVTLRAFLIGIACVALLNRIALYSNRYIGNTFVAPCHFPIWPVTVILILALPVNIIFRKSGYLRALSSGELITIWCMMIVSASIPSHGLVEYLLGTLVGLRYFASPENDWENLFYRYVPDWLYVSDVRAAKGYYQSSSSGLGIPWGAWLKPLTFWVCFAFLLWFMMMCLSTIMRKQWVEQEKFAFPLVEVPTEMAEEPSGSSLVNTLFKNRLLWFSIALLVAIESLNALHFYVPRIPRLGLRFSADSYLSERPWWAARPLIFNIYPFAVGLTYFMSLEISFSLWFFYVFCKIEHITAEAMGIPIYRQGFVPHREMGAYIVLAGLFFWMARKHIKALLMSLFKKHDKIDDTNEPLSYSTAVLGLIVGGVITSLMLKMAGASFLMVFLNIMAFVIIVACVDTWLVTRGLFFIHGSFKIPDFFISILGTQRFDPATLTIIAFPKRVFFRDRREFPMPHMMNALKMSDAGNLNRKHLALAMAGAIFVGTTVACYSNMKLLYSVGGLNIIGSEWIQISSPQEPFWELSQFLQSPSSTDWQQVVFIIVGAVFTMFLTFMRRIFLWWPLHPIGFVTPGQFPMNTGLWFSIFVGWLIKYVVMRYGGLKTYRAARPIFMGIIIGEGIVLVPWAVVGFITRRGYNFFTV